MIISQYGIDLKRVEYADLELIRSWRNSDYVKQFMVFRGYITKRMQTTWFKKINNDQNYYFLIFKNGIATGLANIKDIDNELKSGENGIFLSSPAYVDAGIGIAATLSILDFAFFDLNLNLLIQTIIVENKTAQNFNKHLGVKIEESNEGILKGFLTKQSYIQKTNKIKDYLNNKNYE